MEGDMMGSWLLVMVLNIIKHAVKVYYNLFI